MVNACLGLFCSLSFLPIGDRIQDLQQDQLHQVVEILSQPEDDKIHRMYFHLDDNDNILDLVRISDDSEAYVPFQDLVAGEVVMAVVEGRDAVILSCPECSETNGGTLYFRYLTNGLNDSYDTMSLEIRKDDQWNLYFDAQKVETMTLVSRRVFGRLIGIKEIKINDWSQAFHDH